MAELQRVIASPDFATSQRNRAFLKLAVKSTLQGRVITGYDVAVEAFGRPETFDACRDPIVRIECSKLRNALEMYYLKSGRTNPLRITIPKGGYRAVFLANKQEVDGEDNALPIDSKSAVLLRAAIAGWAAENAEASRVWRELQQTFPGFPLRSAAAELMERIRRKDGGLHSLLEEGLRQLGRRASSASQVAEVAA